MTDNEIIKALECCSSLTISNCKECPYKGKPCCVSQLKRDAAALIKRQQKTIDWLATPSPREGLFLPKSFLKKVKAEAIKEFAGKLKTWHSYDKYDVEGHKRKQIVISEVGLNNLVKEMVGDSNA